MASLLRLFILIIISAIYAEAKTSTENLIIDESEIYDFSNSSKIEEGDFSEEVPTSSSDYIWIVNLKKGPYASKEDAIKAQLDLKQMLDPTLSNFLNEISLDQGSNPSKTKKINNANLSWMINLKLNVFQSKEKALSIITKIEETQEISENILLTRESIAKKKHKLPAVIQREITGKIFLSQETSPLKKDENFLILITTRGNSLNVRERPSSSSPVIAKLSKGTKVPQIKNDLDGIGKKGWFYVEYEKEKYGWISSSFSKKIIDSSIEIKQPAKLAHKLLEKSQAPEINQIKPDKPIKVLTAKKSLSGTKGEEIISAGKFKNLTAKSSKEITALQLTIKSLRSKLNQIKSDKIRAIESRNLARTELQRTTTETNKKIKNLTSTTDFLQSKLTQFKSDKDKLIKTNNKLQDEIETTIFDNKNNVDSLTTVFASLRSELAQIKSAKANLIKEVNTATNKAKKERLAGNKKFNALKETSSTEIRLLLTKNESLNFKLNQIETDKAKLAEVTKQANAKAKKEQLANAKQFEILKYKNSEEIKSLQTTTDLLRSELNKIKIDKAKVVEATKKFNAKANKEKIESVKRFEDFKDKNSKEIKSLQTMTASLRSELDQVKTEKNKLIETNNQANAKANKEKIESVKRFDDLNDKNSKEIKSLQTMTASLRSELNQVKTEKNNLIETNSQANAKANKEILASNKKFDDLNDKNSKEIKSLQTMTASLRSELNQVKTEKNKLIESANQANFKANEEKIAKIKEFEFLKEKNSKETKSLQTMTASLRSELDQVETEKNKLIESANQANVKANKEKIAKIKELKSLESSKNKETESLKTKIKNLRIVLEKFKKEKLKTAKSRESTSEKIEIERIIRAKEITSLKKQTINLKLELDKTELNRIKAIEEMNLISKRTQAYRIDKEKELNQIKQNNTKEVNSLRIVVSSLQKKLDKFQGGEIRPTQKESLLSPTSKAQRETNSVITSIRKQLAEFKGEKTRTTQNKPLLNTASQSQSEKDFIKKKRKNIISKPSSIVASSESANQNDTPASSMDIVTSHLYDWVNAWQNKKVKQYLAFYSNNFKDLKRSRSKWETYKRRSLRTKSNLFIEISDIKVRFLQEDLIKTTFVQKYKSKRVTDIGVKDIYWKKERNGWNIIKEVWRPL